VLRGNDVRDLLQGRDRDVLNAVRAAYIAHDNQDSALPYSCFLRFPHRDSDRIIALPAYLGGDVDVAGLKWIASFPDNVAAGRDRASAIIVLNSMSSGRPETILEGAVISAARTAASAALAASVLHTTEAPAAVGLIGCGPINAEILRFLLLVFPSIERVHLHDLHPGRAAALGDRCRDLSASIRPLVAASTAEVLRRCRLVSFATTAPAPHVDDIPPCPGGRTVLHVSLRDLSVRAILASDNVVDDVEHVCRNQTSVHLAQQAQGDTGFIRCTLADVLLGRAVPRCSSDRSVVFSPFGLGVLDLAVSHLVVACAKRQDAGQYVDNFFTEPWRAVREATGVCPT
jgi:2,3-diaminopropionate biosynthesis protein SbnB